MRKIEKLSRFEPKTLKGKRKKNAEVLSQITPNSATRTSNVASASETQNMGAPATSRGEELLEAQEHEALRAYAHQESEHGEDEAQATNAIRDLEVCGVWAQAHMLHGIVNTGLEA